MTTPNPTGERKERYEALCDGPDCFKVVKEDDIERGVSGKIYERSKKCWDCRTDQDRKAIKRFRKETNKKRRASLPKKPNHTDL